ncbi:ribonuclease P protein component [Prochlorothrix hollandica]|uniref:Ribonuclease P protein component n=1 Tax=Prochlorothrix hollandica PCC 9006 = CALU 1027 TaxID=317619 RepID=A0A0M2PPT5_PROHO|nr:ribonuclease P protein component [Prochlorothrix hollandica]KKI98269.1 hypothetical protein PROH_20615 [Prochlorothrix hollandica PCC 9006 = CALU 1027]
MALPRLHRLRHRQDFDRLYRKGRRFSATCLMVRVLPSMPSTAQPGAETVPRVAVVVSQKVSKRAVVRNRIRRQIQAIIQDLLPQLLPGLGLLISAKPPAVGCDYSNFLQELEQLLQEAEVFHGHS